MQETLSEPPPITLTERHKLIVEWNRTQAEYPREACFHQLFEAQAERSPEAIAVDSGGLRLTYRELDARANRLAHGLRGFGVGPDVLVGVCVEPTVEMLVSLLGILKAGGAYVPLDAAYPQERLHFMIEDAAMPVIVTQRKLIAGLPPSAARLVCIDESPNDEMVSTRSGPVTGVSADHLAYVIYTSGSTGRPKGVMIPHRGLVNYLTWAVAAYDLAGGAGAPVHSSISFDLTITGLFAPLLVGRCVFILSAERGLETLAHSLRQKKKFSLLKITPAHLELLSRQLSPAEAEDCARAFIVGGEALPGESIRFWQENSPDTVVVNEYGPTETVVGCCVYSVERGERFSGAIPIGRPIANTQLYVLDAEMQPVPVGAKGELFIGGDGLARGYLNRPEITARSFVSNPFVAEDPNASAKLYRTGDLVRYLPDGNLEFLGRIDHQVKIRGYRIEPGEVESVLASHPEVQGAVVLACDDRFGEKQLAAYVAGPEGCGVAVAALREFLQQRLPDYMIPAVFVRLSKFPLTANGKVDRTALPPPDLEPAPDQGQHVAPGTEIEIKLVGIWQEVLQLKRVGSGDNFFDIGGHSLLAVRLLSQINHAFGTQLDVLTFYQNPTIRELAGNLQTEQPEKPRVKLITVREGNGGRPIFFLNTGLELFSLASQLEGEEPFIVSDVPWAPEILESSVRLDLAKLPTLEELAAPHTALILESGRGKSCFLAGYSYGGPLALEIAHQLWRRGMVVDAVFLFDSDIKISGWRKFKYWMARQLDRVRRHGLNRQLQSAQERLRQGKRRRMSLAQARSNAPFAVHLASGDVPWEVFDRIWLHALRRYTPRPVAARGFLFRAKQPTYGEKRDYDGCLGWSRLFDGGLEVIEVPGDHWTMWKEPNAAALGQMVQRSLVTLRRTGGNLLFRATLALVGLSQFSEDSFVNFVQTC